MRLHVQRIRHRIENQIVMMCSRIQRLIAGTALLCLISPLAAADPADVPERVARAIEDLSHEDFAVRTAATESLKKVGRPAIAPLTTAALGDDLETTNRALQILASFYRLEDEAALDELDTSLERLADSDRPSAARRAAAAIRRQAVGRDRRAVKKLLELKAIIPPNRFASGLRTDLRGTGTIWIDDQWQGGESELKLFRRVIGLTQLYYVEGCPASLDSVRKLEQLIPKSSSQIHRFSVQERGAACLGLGDANTEPVSRGFVIGNVTPFGSVGSAGLRDYDIIISYGGKRVDNFFQLVELIKNNKVGETVEVQYIRLTDGDPRLPRRLQKRQLQPPGNPESPKSEIRTAAVKLKSWRQVFDAEEQARIREAQNRTNTELPTAEPQQGDEGPPAQP